jgi:hypothetical protein
LTTQLLCRVFWFPIGLFVSGCIPVLSWFLYSGHGGLAWLILPFCFPYIVLRLVLALWKQPAEQRRSGVKIAVTAILLYMLISYPMTRWTEHDVTSSIGLPIRPGILFKLSTFPVGYALPPYENTRGAEQP